MADVTELRPKPPAPHIVCGLTVACVDGEWWVFRPGSRAWRRRTKTFWRPVAGPVDTRDEAERCARRFALRPLHSAKEHHA